MVNRKSVSLLFCHTVYYPPTYASVTEEVNSVKGQANNNVTSFYGVLMHATFPKTIKMNALQISDIIEACYSI